MKKRLPLTLLIAGVLTLSTGLFSVFADESPSACRSASVRPKQDPQLRHLVEALGYSPSVASRIINETPDVAKILTGFGRYLLPPDGKYQEKLWAHPINQSNGGPDSLRPLTVYRGICATLEEYDPKYREFRNGRAEPGTMFVTLTRKFAEHYAGAEYCLGRPGLILKYEIPGLLLLHVGDRRGFSVLRRKYAPDDLVFLLEIEVIGSTGRQTLAFDEYCRRSSSSATSRAPASTSSAAR